MSSRFPALAAVQATQWSAAHEAKLAKALRENPIIVDWLLDAQADSVEDQVTRAVNFEEPVQATALAIAYSKGRVSVLMELMAMASSLLEQPASE